MADREQREPEKYHEAAHRALAVEAITRWNALMQRSPKPRYSPQLGVAITAGFYFLDVWCPGCRQLKQVDLRTLDRHPQTTLFGLIPSLSCRSCQPHPPFARIRSVSAARWESTDDPPSLPSRRT